MQYTCSVLVFPIWMRLVSHKHSFLITLSISVGANSSVIWNSESCERVLPLVLVLDLGDWLISLVQAVVLGFNSKPYSGLGFEVEGGGLDDLDKKLVVYFI